MLFSHYYSITLAFSCCKRQHAMFTVQQLLFSFYISFSFYYMRFFLTLLDYCSASIAKRNCPPPSPQEIIIFRKHILFCIKNCCNCTFVLFSYKNNWKKKVCSLMHDRLRSIGMNNHFQSTSCLVSNKNKNVI